METLRSLPPRVSSLRQTISAPAVTAWRGRMWPTCSPSSDNPTTPSNLPPADLRPAPSWPPSTTTPTKWRGTPAMSVPSAGRRRWRPAAESPTWSIRRWRSVRPTLPWWLWCRTLKCSAVYIQRLSHINITLLCHHTFLVQSQWVSLGKVPSKTRRNLNQKTRESGSLKESSISDLKCPWSQPVLAGYISQYFSCITTQQYLNWKNSNYAFSIFSLYRRIFVIFCPSVDSVTINDKLWIKDNISMIHVYDPCCVV